MRNKQLRRMVLIAMLGSIATVLMKLNFPLPALPPFLKFDFGEVPAVLAVMTMGPVAGIAVEFIKNVLYWFLSGSPTGVPVGEIANFVTGILFIMPVYFIFNQFKHKKGLVSGFVAGTLTMAIGMSVLNYAVFLPMYTYFLGMEPVTGDALYQMIVLGILPFNFVKGVIIAVASILLYKKMGRWINQQQTDLQS